MLTYVPYTFDLYTGFKRHLRDSAARMVSFANRKGDCWFSVRTFGRVAGVSKSTSSRHLAELTDPALGFATRRRVPGGGYEYKIAAQFLARGAVSHGQAPGVPRVRPKEKVGKNKEVAWQNEAGELPDERAQWPQRMRHWHQSRFWRDTWGAKPGERGCRVPRGLLCP
jgi:hypothetical protein